MSAGRRQQLTAALLDEEAKRVRYSSPSVSFTLVPASLASLDVQNHEGLIGAIPRCHISATRQGDPCPAAQPGQQQQAPTADLLAARAAGRATPLRVARSCETVDQNPRRVWRFMDSRRPLLRARARIRARRCGTTRFCWQNLANHFPKKCRPISCWPDPRVVATQTCRLRTIWRNQTSQWCYE